MRGRSWTAGPELPAAAAVLPLVVFEYLRHAPSADVVWQAPGFHFFVVSAAATLAAVAAAAVGVVGWQRRNIQVSLLSLGFMSLTMLFGLHGLATPGFILEVSHLPAVAGSLSLLVTAGWLALSSAPSTWRPIAALARYQGLLVPAWALILLAVVAACLAWPHLWDAVPVHLPPLSWAVGTLTIGAALVAAARYWHAHTYSGFPLPRGVVYASGWIAAASWIQLNGTVWRASWWTYHLLLLAATAVLVWGVMRQYASSCSLAELAGEPPAAEPALAQLGATLPDSVRALIVATEARDPYTAGHSLRVTVQALRLGRAMGLSHWQLRALAHAALVHDVGKIEVPDAILNKPGPLTPDERRIVERHPVTGHRMCSRLGFLPEELGAIRHHHERWDGTGYPDRLAGEAIPLLARVLAVVDVYDALTSERSYRQAWSHDQAFAYILQQAGSQFDPECVKAWSQLVAGGLPAQRAPSVLLEWRPHGPVAGHL